MLNNENDDEQLYSVLSNPEKSKCYTDNFLNNKGRRCKKFQTIVLKNLNIGLIIEQQHYIVGAYEDINGSLGKVIGECDISLDIKCTNSKKTEPYGVIDIKISCIVKNVPHRNLGKLLLFSQGIKLKNGEEAHHTLHAMLNFSDTVKAVPKSKNAGVKQKLSTTEALKYIQTDKLKLSDADYKIFLYNIRFISKYFKTYRGIYINDFDLASTYLNENSIKNVSIELSKL